MAELIEMPFWVVTRVVPINHVLDGAQFPARMTNFGGNGSFL